MHFVSGFGTVADNPSDASTDTHSFALYKPIAFLDDDVERCGQIVGWGKSDNAYVVSARGRDGLYRDFYVKWSVLFQRFESVTKY